MDAISEVATNLEETADGFWVARSHRPVSQPAEGNENCFAVEDGSYWFHHRNNVIIRLVEAFPPTGTVFDVGGGNGFVAMALQRAGFPSIVVEPGPQGAINSRKRGVPVVIQSTLEDAGFKDESIAAFGLFDVLEHIERDLEFLQTLHAHLVQHGYLYLTVPAHPLLWSSVDEYSGHFRRYTVRTLTRTLQTAGFHVEYCSYLFWFLAPAIFFFRSLPGRFRNRRSVSTAKTDRQHSTPSGPAGRLLHRFLALELDRIAKRKPIPFGSSCIAVARKGTG